jgi:hypothetical protein
MLQSLRHKLSGDEPKETYVQDWLNRRWCRVLIPGCSRILHDALVQPPQLIACMAACCPPWLCPRREGAQPRPQPTTVPSNLLLRREKMRK